MRTEIKYGMIIEMVATPISYAFGGIGITSSSTKKEKATFVVSKYHESDTDANIYKVTLKPTAEFKERFGNEKLYSMDLRSLINEGIAVVKD